MIKDPLTKGRSLARWCKEGLHRQGDAYLAAIYFFVHDDPAIVKEGIDLIKWSVSEAVKLCGCGRHIVPTDEIAQRQLKTVIKHSAKLPRALRRFGLLLPQIEPHDAEKSRHLLHQIFLELLVTPDVCLDNKKYRYCQQDAEVLTDYFLLGLGTVRRALKAEQRP